MLLLSLALQLVLAHSLVQPEENLKNLSGSALGGHLKKGLELLMETEHLKLSMVSEELNQESISLQYTTTPTGRVVVLKLKKKAQTNKRYILLPISLVCSNIRLISNPRPSISLRVVLMVHLFLSN